MKKIFLSIVTMTSALFMVSCGGNNSADNKDVDSVEATEVADDSFTGDKSSVDAVKHYAKSYGLDFSDIEPSFRYDTERSVLFTGEPTAITANFVPVDGEYKTEMMLEAVKKVYAATKAVADGGKIIRGWEEAENASEAMSEMTIEEVLKGKDVMGFHVDQYAWGWQQNGKFRRCLISVTEDLRLGKEIGYSVNIFHAIDKSSDELLEDAAKAVEDIENDPEKKAAVNKALKEAGLK